MSKSVLNYKDAGVNIAQANALVSDIRQIASRTRRPGVLGSIGSFGALFELPTRFRNPVLVSGTDGVGTKLKLAVALNKHDTIGIDLVAMCVNDIACLGAEPLFFLDYFATGRLDPQQARTILNGIGKGCELAGAALIGGETAEMPGMYQGEDYDLAGFCVGIVEKDQIIDGHQVQIGDYLIGIASTGLHSNGFSLVRHILEKNQIPLDTPFGNGSLGEVLLTPTQIYVSTLKALQKALPIHAIAHITGGGLIDNLPRILPSHSQAAIDCKSWKWPPIFSWLQEQGQIDTQEMYHAFNLGVGIVICVNKRNLETALDILKATGDSAWVIGQVEISNNSTASVKLQ